MPVAAVRVAPVVAPATVATVATALRRIEGAAVSDRRVAVMIAIFGSLVAGASNGAVSGPPQVEQARREGEKKEREKKRKRDRRKGGVIKIHLVLLRTRQLGSKLVPLLAAPAVVGCRASDLTEVFFFHCLGCLLATGCF